VVRLKAGWGDEANSTLGNSVLARNSYDEGKTKERHTRWTEKKDDCNPG
jgi:hypothetical protein